MRNTKRKTEAAVYVRMKAEESPVVIAKQINALLRMIDRNEESLVSVYADEASGLGRPEFQKMLGDAKGGRFAKLYIRDVARVKARQVRRTNSRH